MKIKRQKKGFTIVELVIVIAVIGVLAAILIPTFAGLIRKANVAADTALVKNVNTALAMSEANGTNKTVSDALADAEGYGYSVDKLTPSQKGYHFVYDMSKNRFALISDEHKIVYSEGGVSENTTDLWYILSSTEGLREGYSVYLTTEQSEVTLNKLVGIEGTIGTLTITDSASTASVVIAGTFETVTVNTPQATVNFYGEATTVNIDAIANNSFHIFGSVNLVKASSGRVVLEGGSAVNVVYVAQTGVSVNVSISATVAQIAKASGVTVEVPGYTVAESTLENALASATEFAGGVGTEAKPFLIANAEQMQNITKYYESETAHHFKIKDGVTEIDCSEVEWASIKLNGSFDGNGVTFNNVSSYLFRYVGNGTEQNLIVKNFSVNFNIFMTGDYAVGTMVHTLANAGTTTFENIFIHGYMESFWNGGSFYAYGPGNYVSGGDDYTVYFNNCKSDVQLVIASATSTYSAGAFIGHTYPGDGNVATIYFDEDCAFTGTITAATYNDCKKYIAIWYNKNDSQHEVYKKVGNQYVRVDVSENVDYGKDGADNCYILEKSSVTKDSSYTVENTAGATKVVVNVVAQLTSEQSAGITKILDSYTIDLDISGTTSVAELFTNVELNAEGITETKIENGTLYIYAPEYIYGTVRLVVSQRDNNNIIKSTAVTLLASKANADSNWVIA